MADPHRSSCVYKAKFCPLLSISHLCQSKWSVKCQNSAIKLTCLFACGISVSSPCKACTNFRLYSPVMETQTQVIARAALLAIRLVKTPLGEQQVLIKCVL